jgi:hypothetical protein
MTLSFKPPKQGANPPSGNPLMYHFDGRLRRKSDHFFYKHYQTKKTGFGA